MEIEYSEKEKIEKLREKYKLTEKEFEDGLRRIRKMLFKRKAPINEPSMVLVGGQQGSGKSQILIHHEFSDGNVVIISLDEFTAFHPRAREIRKSYPDLFAYLTLESGYRWRKVIYDEVVSGKYNAMTEMTIKDKENDPILIRELKKEGYKVNIRVMATSLYESVASVYERYILQKSKKRIYPRLTECTSAYDKISETVEVIEEQEISDEVSIYIRGTDNFTPKRVYKNEENSRYLNGNQALVEERENDDKNARTTFVKRCKDALEKLSGTDESYREQYRLAKDIEEVKRYYSLKRQGTGEEHLGSIHIKLDVVRSYIIGQIADLAKQIDETENPEERVILEKEKEELENKRDRIYAGDENLVNQIYEQKILQEKEQEK